MTRFRPSLIPAWLVMLIAAVGCQRQLPPDQAPNRTRAQQIRQKLNAAATARPAQASSQPTQKPTGWATLRGVLKLEGSAPARAALAVNKDSEVCAPGGKQVFSESLVVAADGGIKDAVIYVTSKFPDQQGWIHPSAKRGKTDPVTFDQKQCTFVTHVLAMQTTQKLNILNSDPVGHNTNMSPDRNSAFNSTIPVGGQAVYQPDSQERQPFSVTCSIHPWMQAWIITRDNSYFAVTKPDGSFEIPNLPAGVDLEFRLWQEKSRFLPSAKINGKQQKLPKGRLTWKLSSSNEGQNRWDILVDAAVFQ